MEPVLAALLLPTASGLTLRRMYVGKSHEAIKDYYVKVDSERIKGGFLVVVLEHDLGVCDVEGIDVILVP